MKNWILKIYKCYRYRIHANLISQWPRNCEPVRHILSDTDINQFWEDLELVMNITDDVETDYINPKLRNQQTFENQLNDKFRFAYAFRATMDQDSRISKEIRFFYRESEQHGWIMGFTASIRMNYSRVLLFIRSEIHKMNCALTNGLGMGNF